MKQPIKKEIKQEYNLKDIKHRANKSKKKDHPDYNVSKLEDRFAEIFLDKLKVKYVRQFEAKDIAYHEFGTGIYAQGSYPDNSKLPTQTLTFESPKGKQQTTQGWEYYYKNPDTKRSIGGKAGWFIGNGVFVTGNVAGAEVYYTSKALREDASKIAKKAYKGD